MDIGQVLLKQYRPTWDRTNPHRTGRPSAHLHPGQERPTQDMTDPLEQGRPRRDRTEPQETEQAHTRQDMPTQDKTGAPRTRQAHLGQTFHLGKDRLTLSLVGAWSGQTHLGHYKPNLDKTGQPGAGQAHLGQCRPTWDRTDPLGTRQAHRRQDRAT